jgi:hypothetical protein
VSASSYVTLARFRSSSPVSTFSPIVYPFLGVFAVTRGNVCVRVKLSDACPFSPDVARFHVFAHRLAVFRRFYYNTGQCTWPRHVKRHLPIFAQHRPFPRFRPSLSRFQVFPVVTWGQRTCPRQVKRRLPDFTRRRPFLHIA